MLGCQTVTGDSHLSRQLVMLMTMDAEPRPVTGPAASGQGSYLGRAQALLTARAELFAAPSRPPARTVAPAGTRLDRGQLDRASARQLSLPLPRERRRRRSRMLG
jgi:hypothetical protein